MTVKELEYKIKTLENDIRELTKGWKRERCYGGGGQCSWIAYSPSVFKKYGLPVSMFMIGMNEYRQLDAKRHRIITDLQQKLFDLKNQLQFLKQQKTLEEIQEEYRKRDEMVRAEAARKIKEAREEAERKIAEVRAEAEAKVQAAREEADRKVKLVKERLCSSFFETLRRSQVLNITPQMADEMCERLAKGEIEKITKLTDEKIRRIREQADEEVKRIRESYDKKIKAITAENNKKIKELEELIDKQAKRIADFEKRIGSQIPVLENKLKNLSITLEERIKPFTDIEKLIAKYLPKETKPETKVQFNWKL